MSLSVDIRPDFMLSAFDSLSIAAFIVDKDSNFVSLNKTAEDIFQHGSEELKGRSIEGIIFESGISSSSFE